MLKEGTGAPGGVAMGSSWFVSKLGILLSSLQWIGKKRGEFILQYCGSQDVTRTVEKCQSWHLAFDVQINFEMPPAPLDLA